jgi:hypothetical protein
MQKTTSKKVYPLKKGVMVRNGILRRNKLLIPTLLGVLLFIGLAIFATWYFINTEQTSEEASAGGKAPITGTFIMYDYSDTNGKISEALFREMKSDGIDTIIIMASGHLDISGCATDKTPQTSKYRSIINASDSVNPLKNMLKEAKKNKMRVYLGTVGLNVGYPCYDVLAQKNQKDLLDYSIKSYDEVRAYLGESDWNGGLIDGFYISYEVDLSNAASYGLSNIKYISEGLKSKYPEKKLLLSPYIYEKSTESQAYDFFKTYYSQTKIDIIAPQDSMGTGKTTSYARNTEHFKALQRAANETGKVAWANVETFEMDNSPGGYHAGDFEKIKQQIESSKPYVSKQITWIHPHTLSVIPELRNQDTWVKQYTPINYIERMQLRTLYRKHYIEGIKDIAYFEYNGNLVYKSKDLCLYGSKADVTVNYLDSSSKLKSVYKRVDIKKEGDYYVIYFPLSSLSGYKSLNQSAMQVLFIRNSKSSCDDSVTPPVTTSTSPKVKYTFTFGGNYVIKGTDFGTGKTIKININVNGRSVYNANAKPVKEGNEDVIYIPLTSLTGVDVSKITPASVTITK